MLAGEKIKQERADRVRKDLKPHPTCLGQVRQANYVEDEAAQTGNGNMNTKKIRRSQWLRADTGAQSKSVTEYYN